MTEQISLLDIADGEDIAELKKQVVAFQEYADKKRYDRVAWENAFQKWSNEQGIDGLESYGCCGYGSMCGWCEDNTYGRPCVRALNAMCREKGISIDYSNYDFKEIW